jgi:acetyl esterase/lipase
MVKAKQPMPYTALLVLSLLLTSLAHAGSVIDVAYGADPKQRLDVYYPDPCLQQRCPVVVWVHGGGWRHGDKRHQGAKDIAATWTAAGAVVVTLNYRLTPDVVHPAHVQDVASGIAWIHGHISQYGGDPGRTYLLGHSAGAHLVALVATDPRYLDAHRLGLRQALAGVMSIDTASYDLAANNGPPVGRMIEDAFGTDPAVLRAASPLLIVQPGSRDYPPFVIAVVKNRHLAVQQSNALAGLLPDARVIVEDYGAGGKLRAHGEIARDLADAQSHLARELMKFVGLQAAASGRGARD